MTTKEELWKAIEDYRQAGGREEHWYQKDRLDSMLEEVFEPKPRPGMSMTPELKEAMLSGQKDLFTHVRVNGRTVTGDLSYTSIVVSQKNAAQADISFYRGRLRVATMSCEMPRFNLGDTLTIESLKGTLEVFMEGT